MNPEEILNDFMSRNQKINREKAKRIMNEYYNEKKGNDL